jgi:hypothetical protein
MKRIISTAVLGLAIAGAAMHASAQQHRQVFPDGYYALTPEEMAPIANARSAEEILAGAPRGPSFEGEPLSAADLAGAPGDPDLLALFPQPSFRDYPTNDYARNIAADVYAAKHAEKARLAAAKATAPAAD